MVQLTNMLLPAQHCELLLVMIIFPLPLVLFTVWVQVGSLPVKG